MMEACPHCGSGDLVELEIDDVDDSQDLFECEDCQEQFRREEMA